MPGVLDTLFATDTSYSDLVNPRYWLTSALTSGAVAKTGETVNPSTALTVSAYYACIRAISEDIASMPLIIYRRTGEDGRERATDHPLYRMLKDSPNAAQTSMAMRETVSHHAMGYGNGVVRIVKNGRGVVSALKLIHASRLTRIEIEEQPDGTDELLYVFTNERGDTTKLPSDEVLHIHGLGDDGYQGYSVAKVGCDSIGMGIAAQTFAGTYYANGATPSGVLETPGTLDDPAIDRLRQQWADRYGGLTNSHKPLILEADLKWHTLGVNPEDSQLLESRQFSIEDICRWFRMPPHKVQHLLHSNYNSIEHLSIEYVTDTLRPWFRRWEQEIDKKLLGGGDEYYCEHLIDDLLSADSTARSAKYREMFHIGALSQNDIRRMENMPPVDNGDTYYVPANLLPSEQAAKATRQIQEPNPQRQPDGGNPQPGTGRRVEPKGAYVPVVDEAFARLLRKESKAVARLAVKHAENRQAFDAEAEKFYSEIHDEATENLSAIVAMVLALEESKADGKDVLRAIVDWHIGNSKARIVQRYSMLQAELVTWETRAVASRDKLLEIVRNG